VSGVRRLFLQHNKPVTCRASRAKAHGVKNAWLIASSFAEHLSQEEREELL
jgi:hypothetical protein